MATARIYKPAKTAMQSGVKNSCKWVLTFKLCNHKFQDPIMGWTGSTDTLGQVTLRFSSLEAAVAFATSNHLTPKVDGEHKQQRHPKAYADNFRHNKPV